MIRKLTAKGYSEGDWACPTHPIMSKHVNGEVEYNNAMQAWMDDKQVTSVLVDDGITVIELHREWKAIQVTESPSSAQQGDGEEVSVRDGVISQSETGNSPETTLGAASSTSSQEREPK